LKGKKKKKKKVFTKKYSTMSKRPTNASLIQCIVA
jgi:hypothetical protein